MHKVVREQVSAGEVSRLIARLRSGPGREDPYPGYAQLRTWGPLLPTLWDALLATDHQTCGEVLRSPQWGMPDPAWKDRWLPRWREHLSASYAAKTLMQLNPPEHTEQRAAVLPSLTARRIAGLEPVIERLVGERMQALDAELADQGQADFARLVSDPLPMMVLCALLGLPTGDAWRLAALARDLSFSMEVSPSRRELQTADRAALELRTYLLRAMARARERSTNDVISELAVRPESERDREWAGPLVVALLIAGWQTTASLMSSMVLALDRFPDQAEWLRCRPDRAGQAVEEVLRWDPPSQMISRVAMCDTELAGRPVAAGQLVHVVVGSAQRDPQAVPDAQRLDFSRTGRRSLVFGRGPHYCVGAQLARREGALLLARLAQRPDRLRVAQTPARPRGVNFRDITALVVEAA